MSRGEEQEGGAGPLSLQPAAGERPKPPTGGRADDGAAPVQRPLQPAEHRVLIAAPTRRDADVTCQLLARVAIDCVAFGSLAALADALADAASDGTGLGALILTDAALADPAMEGVSAALKRQPQWSDVPVVLLTYNRDRAPAAARRLSTLTNVTLLDLPSSTRTLVSAVQSALRGRLKQFQIRDQIERQQRAEQALREADLRKDEFLATLAHELRNPLATICNGLQVIEHAGTDAVLASRVVGMMERQSRQLVRLIDDLLDVSRIATGKFVLERQPVDLCAVVDSVLETHRLPGSDGHARLQAELPAHAVWVEGDATRLAQVVGNLLHNAIKYTPSGGVVTLALAQADGQAVVSVSDTGVGIPQAMLDHVFEMFTQVDRTLDRAQGGLGIGLALVRRLVEMHGGTVEARSDGLDRGSRFAVRIPLLRAAAAVSAATPQASAAAVPGGRGLRVLVVDDNVDAAETLATMLQLEHHDAQVAFSGAAALAMAEQFAPDVVFLDIGMPAMDGHEVARRLRLAPRAKAAALVALSGWGSAADRAKSTQSGFDFHLTKPADTADVLRLLQSLGVSRPAA